ncbi:MAG: glycosyltransferase family 2 protein [Bryobacteraceae bacterium]
MSNGPRVSIVTPCLNMGRYLEEAIRSVLAQDYEAIEYIVIDGGSTDNTLEILERYKDRLRYESRPDSGAAEAINRGFALAGGGIFAYLNADDLYLPGAVRAAAQALAEHPDAGVVYGSASWIDADGAVVGEYPTRAFDRELLGRECFICQPAAFIRSGVFDRAGRMDATLQYTFDYDLWLRIARLYPMHRMDARLAHSRMHLENKTLGRRRQVFQETLAMLERNEGYVPFTWVYSYTCYRRDGRDQFFDPLAPSVRSYLAALPMGLARNRRHPWRFLREWFRVMSWAGLLRRLQATHSEPRP